MPSLGLARRTAALCQQSQYRALTSCNLPSSVPGGHPRQTVVRPFRLMDVSILEQKRGIFTPTNRLAAVLCCFKLGIILLSQRQPVILEHILNNKASGILGAGEKLIPSGASGAIAHLCAFSSTLGNVQLFNNTNSENPTVPIRTHRSKFKCRNLHQLTNKRILDSLHISSFLGGLAAALRRLSYVFLIFPFSFAPLVCVSSSSRGLSARSLELLLTLYTHFVCISIDIIHKICVYKLCILYTCIVCISSI